MIDITDWIVKTAKTCDSLGDRVFRGWPQKKMAGKTYAVVMPTTHTPVLMESGEEVIANLGWSVQIVGDSPTALDAILSDLMVLYGRRNIILNGIVHGYSPENRQYTVLASLSATVDRRGCVFI